MQEKQIFLVSILWNHFKNANFVILKDLSNEKKKLFLGYSNRLINFNHFVYLMFSFLY